MSIYLDETIEIYQQQKQQIDRLILAAIEEGDYLSAHYHSNGRRQINYKLQVFNTLQDPNHDQKQYLQKLLDRSSEFYIGRGKGIPEYIQDMVKQLAQLNQRDNLHCYDTQHIDDALFELSEGKLNSFKLILIKEQSLELNFTVSDKILQISFPPLAKIKEKYLLESKIPPLTSLGFKANESGQLAFRQNLTVFKDTLLLKQLLSRIVFDVFFFKELDQPLTLERG